MVAIMVIIRNMYSIIGSEILLAIDGKPLIMPLYIIKNIRPVIPVSIK